MNQYISADLGTSFAPHANDLYLVMAIGCNKIDPIIYDVIKGKDIENVIKSLNLINLTNSHRVNNLEQQAWLWEDYHDPKTIMAFGIGEDNFAQIFFSSIYDTNVFCPCIDFTVLFINKGAYKNMIELMTDVRTLI